MHTVYNLALVEAQCLTHMISINQDVISRTSAGWWIVAKITELVICNWGELLDTTVNLSRHGRILELLVQCGWPFGGRTSWLWCICKHSKRVYLYTPHIDTTLDYKDFTVALQESYRGNVTKTLISNCRSILRVAFLAPQLGNALFPNSSIGGFGKAWISALAGIRLVGWARDVHTPLHGESSMVG
jgi:hypothetical protein